MYNVIREHAGQEGVMKTKEGAGHFFNDKGGIRSAFGKSYARRNQAPPRRRQANSPRRREGVYKLHPNGRKEYVKLYEKEPDTKKVLMAAGCER